MSFYREVIARAVPEEDPRHVEAYMRLTYGTLDHLSPTAFLAAAHDAAADVRLDRELAEDVAASFGLRRERMQ